MRKLNFAEVMLISKLLKQIEIKGFLSGVMTNDYKNPTMISVDVITYILSNIYMAEDILIDLLKSYTGKEDIKNMDVDEITEILTNMFSKGLPKILLDIVDIEGIKKKMKTENPQ